jgi:hypothetical protein
MPAMQVALQPLTDRVNGIARLSALVSCPFLILLLIFIFSQASNRQAGNGEFVVVLFPNGSDPTSPPVSLPLLSSHRHPTNLNLQYDLPALTDVETVRNLTGAQSRRYFIGYYPGVHVPAAANQRPFILRAIGRREA